ncbi:MAG: glutaminyl-peptide cyclotransferase [Spongiibacteraceae bacterium]
MAAAPTAIARPLSIGLILALLLAPAWAPLRADATTGTKAGTTALISYEILARYPHRTGAFTQGLEVVDDALYESSGLYRASFVTRWYLDQTCDPAPDTASASTACHHKTELRRHIAPEYFAEGFTVFGDKAFLLTWRSNKGFVLDANTLAIERSFEYPGEGWGLTHDRESLIMSDGSARLRFLDPTTLRQQKTLDVTEHGKPLVYLNELEWIDAGVLAPQPRLLANIWQTDEIAVIDPQTGVVTARLDLRKLYPRRRSGEDVMNGIAFDPADNTLLITGKRWRYLWRIKLQSPLP